MMKWGGALLLLTIATAYQMAASSAFRLGGVAPDFIFLALGYLAFFAPIVPLLLLSGGWALGLDGISLEPIGTHALGFLPALWLIHRLRGWFVMESPLGRTAIIFLSALLSFELRRLYLYFHLPGGAGWSSSWLASLYTALAGLAAHSLFDACRARLGWSREKRFG